MRSKRVFGAFLSLYEKKSTIASYLRFAMTMGPAAPCMVRLPWLVIGPGVAFFPSVR
jgi:hypothetical protein